MIVAIDDQRPCIGAAVVIRDHHIAVEALFSLAFNIYINELWLDHDLGCAGADVREIIKAIEENVVGRNDHFPSDMKIRILSDNPAGRQYIRQALERYFEVLP